MAKYKVGDKVFFEGVIIDTEANSTFPYRVKFSDGSDEIFREEVLCFSKTYEDGYKDGYKKGKKEALMEVVNCEDAKYNQGLNDAWELARKVSHMCLDDMNKCFDLEDLDKYGADIMLYEHYTPQEALAKIEAYEKSQQIQVGDVVKVRTGAGSEHIGVVTQITANQNCACIVYADGSTEMNTANNMTKTNKHLDIEHLLEQIRGNE